MVYVIGNHMIVFAGNICGAAVGQMSAIGQAHTHHGITRLKQRQLYGCIGLGTGVGLHIGKLSAKQILCSLDAQALNLINILAAAVVTLTGQAFCILVGENRAHGSNNSGGGKIFGGNQLQAILLPVQFPFHHVGEFRVEVGYKANRINGFSVHSYSPSLLNLQQNRQPL